MSSLQRLAPTLPPPPAARRPGGIPVDRLAGRVRLPLGLRAADVAPSLALALLSGTVLRGLERTSVPSASPLRVLVLSAALVLPLAARRRHPVGVFAAVAAAAFVQWLVAVPPGPYDLAVLVSLYAVAEHAGRRWSRPALCVTLAGAVLAWEEPGGGAARLVVVVVLVAATWAVGDSQGARRGYLAALEERSRRLEYEREVLARMARAEERARIAREMHDVVAHRISVMIVQADGARCLLDAEPEEARTALATIADAGRGAMGELRRLLGMLREEAHDPVARPAPQPSVGDLEELVDGFVAAGLPVSVTVQGSPHRLDPPLGLCVYRLVQESLTNTLKHAGAGTPTRVRLQYGPDAVEVVVSDDGPRADRPPCPIGSTGHGVVGMRERVALYGGTFSSHPTLRGGWITRAHLPVEGPA